MDKTTIYDKQNILDICIQETGTIETLFEFAKQNDNMSITDEIEAGAEFKVPVREKAVSSFFEVKRPATGGKLILADGINFMGIEYDFIVSKGEVQ